MKNIFIVVILFFSLGVLGQTHLPWTKIESSNFTKKAGYTVDSQLLFFWDEAVFRENLSAITIKKNAKTEEAEVLIPNMKGILEAYRVFENSNFSPELQAKYPDIRSYSGVGITDPNARLYFSISPNEVQTMVLRSEKKPEFIESYIKEAGVYLLFDEKEKDSIPFKCSTEAKLSKKNSAKTGSTFSNGNVFRTFRLALSCTGEYTSYFGGTKAGALAGMNATMTRVNGIYNRDLGVKLEIIPATEDLIFLDSTTDPYSNYSVGAKGTWSLQLQKTLTDNIGSENYDIGHLFARDGGGGNAGCIGCVCENPTSKVQYGKGSGFTSPANGKPEGDSFDIDYVCHEMGHQLGASHTFSYAVESVNSNIEPGSGSTIMGYAGITDYDIQLHSDDYFSVISIIQIQENLSYTTCSVDVPISTTPLEVNAGDDYTIPASTPFVLKGTVSNPEGFTFCWEQIDSATSTTSGDNSLTYSTKPNGPLFRSFLPTNSPIRYFPSIDKVLNNSLSTSWESVSSIQKTMNFAFTARNNKEQSYAQTYTDQMVITVDEKTGPFKITSQNEENIGWKGGSYQKITWNVNNTNTLPGSETINIKLSIDGGLTFPIILATNTPNDGSEIIKVPVIAEKNCRILIEPVNNIYYAINKSIFAIGFSVITNQKTYSYDASFSIAESDSYTTKTIIIPDEVGEISKVNISVSMNHQRTSDVDFEIISPQNQTVHLFKNACRYPASLNMFFDDGGNTINCNNTRQQTVAPIDLLSNFSNNDASGTWTFRVRDQFVGNIGTINSFGLTIYTKNYTVVEPVEIPQNTLIVSPNPSNGRFEIQYKSISEEPVLIQIFDLQGRLIFTKNYTYIEKFDENIELTNLVSGIYLLVFEKGSTKEVAKIIIL